MLFYRINIFFVLSNFLFFGYVFFQNEINNDCDLTFIISFFIHSFALTRGIGLIKSQKLPYIIPFAAFNLFSYAVAPSLVDFRDFQLGVFNSAILDIFNLGFILLYSTYFVVVSRRSEKFWEVSPVFVFNLSRVNLILLSFYGMSFFLSGSLAFVHELASKWLLGFLLYGYFSRKNTTMWNLVFLLIFLFEVVNVIVGGLIFPLIFLILFLLLCFLVFRFSLKGNFILFFLITIGTSFFANSFSKVKMNYRSIDVTESSTLQKMVIVNNLLDESMSNNNEDENTIFWRLTYPLSAFSVVHEKTPSVVPFWDGESYLPILFKFIPRVIWLNKPKEVMGQTFGHRYKLLSSDNFTTSMNCPMVAESYMNFGPMAIWLFFLFFGVLLGKFNLKLNSLSYLESNPVVEILYRINICITAIYFIQMESNFSMLLGKLVIIQLCMLFIEFLINKKIE